LRGKSCTAKHAKKKPELIWSFNLCKELEIEPAIKIPSGGQRGKSMENEGYALKVFFLQSKEYLET
jgi:hypothetical protein